MDKLVRYFFGGIVMIFMVTACGSDKPESSTPEATAPSPMGSAANAPDQSPSPPVITGKVIETMNSGDYTYMQLDRGDKKSWVALPSTKVTVGEKVSVVQSMVMPNFESKTLGRTFDEVIFASGFASGSKSGCPGPHDKAQKSGTHIAMNAQNQMMGSSRAAVQFQALKIEKAQGKNSYTIGEVFEKKLELNGKEIKVRGKVVKVLENIMGRNWIHLQDGTGNPKDNSHDLVITSSTVPEKDSIITIIGSLSADKDFGAGYKYAVIIEDGKIAE